MVTRVLRGRRGASSTGCLVSLLFWSGRLYYGVNIGELFFRYYRLLDEMQTQAQLAPPSTTARSAAASRPRAGYRSPARGPAD